VDLCYVLIGEPTFLRSPVHFFIKPRVLSRLQKAKILFEPDSLLVVLLEIGDVFISRNSDEDEFFDLR
jgi:hypothetical protein